MQAYEHIMAGAIIFVNSGKEKKSKDKVLEYIRNHAAYLTYSDSARSSFKSSIGQALRQVSHFSENAGMQFVFGEELKNIGEEGYPKDKLFGYEGLSARSADLPTDLNQFFTYNNGLEKTKKGRDVLLHLTQDAISDDFYQGDFVKCNVNSNSETIQLYGVTTQGGNATVVRNGRNIPITMDEFRSGIVAPMQQLTTYEVYKKLKASVPDISLDEIQEAVHTSYGNIYPDCMSNVAKNYAVPSGELRAHLEADDKAYFESIKESLVGKGYFDDKADLNTYIGKYIERTTTARGIMAGMHKRLTKENFAKMGFVPEVEKEEVKEDVGYPEL